MNDTRITVTQRNLDTEALLARYALRVAARLSEQSAFTAHDVSERLRIARQHALDRARVVRVASLPQALVHTGGGTAALTRGGGSHDSSPWWARLASVLPLVALVAGLMLIQNQHLRAQISAAAEVDVDLLLDELPPAAYGDPGFLEFLKAPHE